MSTEATLIALAVAIYLFDCIVLLQRGQAIVEVNGRRRRLQFGNRFYVIRGKPVALLNPFTPHIAAFLTLSPGQARTGAALRISKLGEAVAWPKTFAAVQFATLFIVMPVFLYGYPAWAFLGALAFAYLNLIALLFLLARTYRGAGLPWTRLGGPAFSSIVCLPLSANLLRRATLRIHLNRDALSLLRLVPVRDREAAAADLLGQLTEALDELPEDSPDAVTLNKWKASLERARAHGSP